MHSVDKISLYTLEFLRQALSLVPTAQEIKSWVDSYPPSYRNSLKAEAMKHWKWLGTYIHHVDKEMGKHSAEWLTASLQEALTSTLLLHVHVLSCRGHFLAPYLEQKLGTPPPRKQKRTRKRRLDE